MLQAFKNPIKHRRTKSFSIGMWKTSPFIAAGILSLVLYYSKNNTSIGWDKDLVIWFIFFLLSCTVYFAVSLKLPYSKKNVIDDLLMASFYQLGESYRLNIMTFNTSEGHASFAISNSAGVYQNSADLKKNIEITDPGAPEAWVNKKGDVIYHPKSELRAELDERVKHLWSVAIKARRGHNLAVLNIDNIDEDTLSQDKIDNVTEAVSKLSELLAYYWEISV